MSDDADPDADWFRTRSGIQSVKLADGRPNSRMRRPILVRWQDDARSRLLHAGSDQRRHGLVTGELTLAEARAQVVESIHAPPSRAPKRHCRCRRKCC